MASNDTVWYHAPHSEWSKVVNRNDTSQYGFWGRCRGAAAQGVRRGGAQGVFGERLCGHHHVVDRERGRWVEDDRSEEHTSELQSLMRISYAVFCLKKKK